MNRCRLCVMPDTRPDTPFINGVCSACITYANRLKVDWAALERLLLELLDRHHGECIVPSSGGKDSTYQAVTLKAMGADVLVVTARTCQLTDIGRANIDNLARHCETIEYVPNMKQRAKLNRLGLEMVGDISHPEHMAIFTVPFRAALQTGRSLIMFGENPQAQYGGPLGTEEAREMTLRWRSEFGGLLGLRPSDLESMVGDMSYYVPPSAGQLAKASVEAHFLGHYLPWDSHRNAEVATVHGFRCERPTLANWWVHENLDNAQTGLHDFFMFLKYGFGRGCQQISVDVRAGRINRPEALRWVEICDGMFPECYAGVPVSEVLDRIGMTRDQMAEIAVRFTNPDILHGREIQF